jgi:adenosylmethionine-8-amino-7-oxononanoate aminotransferase
MEREGLYRNVIENQDAFRTTLERLYDLPIVGDVRGDGYFWAVELVKDRDTKLTFDAAERELLIRRYLPGALLDNGLYCRPDDRGDPVIQLAPPLICGQAEFDEMERILRATLIDATRVVADHSG